jgi:hypothetical protein
VSHKTTSDSVNRRTFGALLAASGGVPALLAQQAAPPAPGNFRRPLAPDLSPFEGKLEFARQDVPLEAEPFSMNEVRLPPNSVYHDAEEWNRGYMSRLAADRLLYTYRAKSGLPVGSATPLGGWGQPENGQRSSELRGHFPGHFLSAAAAVNDEHFRDARQLLFRHGVVEALRSFRRHPAIRCARPQTCRTCHRIRRGRPKTLSCGRAGRLRRQEPGTTGIRGDLIGRVPA